MKAGGLRMAFQTDGIALGDGGGILLGEGDQPLEGGAPRLRMGSARAVAVLTPEGSLAVLGCLRKSFPMVVAENRSNESSWQFLQISAPMKSARVALGATFPGGLT
jgi:hypothetical protein